MTTTDCRLDLSASNYLLIEPPELGPWGYYQLHVGKSEKGVYCTYIPYRSRLKVWFLNESSDKMEWVLKCENDLEPTQVCRLSHDERVDTPWLLHCYNEDKYYADCYYSDDESPAYHRSGDGWPSDNDMTLYRKGFRSLSFLGSHPFKEVAFISESHEIGLAYHLNNSRIEDLGSLILKRVLKDISQSFVYTPCWIGELPTKNYVRNAQSFY